MTNLALAGLHERTDKVKTATEKIALKLMPPEEGQMLTGRFRIIQTLRKSAKEEYEVYLVHDIKENRNVVIKTTANKNYARAESLEEEYKKD